MGLKLTELRDYLDFIKKLIIAGLQVSMKHCSKQKLVGEKMFVFETNYGSFTVELDFANAPISSKNFQNYADSGFYDGTIFHRVINDFMIQGGGFEPGLTQKSTEESIENEANNGLSNELGTLAMARTADPHSASSQFFINVSDNFFLDHKDTSSQGWGYAVFGKL